LAGVGGLRVPEHRGRSHGVGAAVATGGITIVVEGGMVTGVCLVFWVGTSFAHSFAVAHSGQVVRSALAAHLDRAVPLVPVDRLGRVGLLALAAASASLDGVI
jgi:hypothetical protein